MASIFGSITYGDTSGDLSDHSRGGDQILSISYAFPQSLVGDANALTGHAVGGDDTLTSGSNQATLVGDALTISDHARGGNDSLTAADGFPSETFGDAITLSGHAHGGDDTLRVGGYGDGLAAGDASLLTDHAMGGADTLFGDSSRARMQLMGDAETMTGHARGGDDVLSIVAQGGGGDSRLAFGDARMLAGHSHGGNDLLTVFSGGLGGGGAKLYGDGEQLLDHATGGDDTLVGGSNLGGPPSNDTMYGDAAGVGPHATTGADLFVFAPHNGHDQIMDFQPGKDRIELDGFGFTGFHDLASHFQTAADGVLISFDPADDILVRNVSVAQLTACDFVLA